MSTTWFVGADWLAEHIDDPEIQIIDARMASHGQEDRNVAQEYLNGHIPGAVFLISKRFLITLPASAHAAAPGNVRRGDA